MARPIQSDVAAATSPTVDDGPTPNGAPTLMSMRQSPTTIAPPRLDTRLALGARMPATPRRELEQDRSDLIAPGVPRGRTDSPWQPSGGGSMRAVGEPYHAKIRSNGKIEFNDKPNIELEGLQLSKQYRIPVLAGHFDITDAVMSALGEQLYPYRKMRLMEESREMRAEMAFESNEHDLRHALTNYGQHLKWVWRQSEPSLLERRKALFLLWDECAEEGSTELLTSARSIRAMTLSFIRANLPQDSGDGYSALELQRLNQRRKSSVQFAPY
ncbi:MAG: hypothetical protein GY811_08275 [Myxococcales bacterium]|nr:hypothetical protein [Myxococcales bacterium]